MPTVSTWSGRFEAHGLDGLNDKAGRGRKPSIPRKKIECVVAEVTRPPKNRKRWSVAANAGLFLEGLLGDEQRKTGWMRAEAAGDPGPWRQQAILGRRDWDADALRDIVRDYVIEHLADDDAVLVIDETGFLKQGKASCGVSRQYTGSAGKITNCQIGVFATYVSRHGHAIIDRALYLPKEWTDDPDRLEAAYVPPDAGFATKPKLAPRVTHAP